MSVNFHGQGYSLYVRKMTQLLAAAEEMNTLDYDFSSADTVFAKPDACLLTDLLVARSSQRLLQTPGNFTESSKAECFEVRNGKTSKNDDFISSSSLEMLRMT